MTLPRTQRCELCLFWSRKHELATTPTKREPGNEQGVARGECQRYPRPQETDPNYGCGEFQVRT